MDFELFKIHAETVKEVGVLGLKTLLTLNSGAIVILLVFYANIIKVSKNIISIEYTITSIKCFYWGIFLALLSLLTTYIFAQFKYNNPKKLYKYSLWLKIMPAVCSFALFAFGGYYASFSVENLDMNAIAAILGNR